VAEAVPVVISLCTRGAVRVVESQQPCPVQVMQRERILDGMCRAAVTATSALRKRMDRPLTNQYRRRS
jgi:hypothetical protein